MSSKLSHSEEVIASDMSWEQYFISLSYMIALKSKDPSTKVGAVVVGQDHEIRATGYNGLPRGVRDFDHLYKDRIYKYAAGNHAEENAILNAARIGIALRDCSIYVPWFPCAHCARLIIQVGISSVIYHHDFPGNSGECFEHWEESMKISRSMLNESGVQIRAYHGPVFQVSALYMGKKCAIPLQE